MNKVDNVTEINEPPRKHFCLVINIKIILNCGLNDGERRMHGIIVNGIHSIVDCVN